MEKWKWIKKWEDVYMISDLGRVKSMPNRANSYKETIRKLTPHYKSGYLQVTLCHNNYRKNCLVHRLVAEAFIENKEALPEVNHKKGEKQDNTVNSLNWMSSRDNKQHAFDIGLRTGKKGIDNHFSRQVGRYLNGQLIEEYKYMKMAQEQGYSHAGILQAINNNWLHKGFNWKYLDQRRWERRTVSKPKRKIACYLDEEAKKEYTDINEAIKDGYDKSNLYKALKNPTITVGGFNWKYLN